MRYLLPVLAFASFSLHAQTTHNLTVNDNGFFPDTLSVLQGDSVRITFGDLDHTVREVTKQTWLSDSSTLAGSEYGPPTSVGETVTIAMMQSDTMWYVCAFHVEMNGEKGFIAVSPFTSVQSQETRSTVVLWPEPSEGTIWLSTDRDQPVMVDLFDASGKLVWSRSNVMRSFDPTGLDAGRYYCVVSDLQGVALLRKGITLLP